MSSDVAAAADSMALMLPQEARAAWYAYVAAQAQRDAAQDGRIVDIARSLATLRGDLDSAIDSAVRHALEDTELTVRGLGALVDAMASFERRLELMERRGDVRTEMLRSILERIDGKADGAEGQ